MPSSAERAAARSFSTQHALFERGLALGFQRVHRRVAFGELRGEFAQARVELAALAAHALQRLRQARRSARAAIPRVSASACAASRDSRAALRAASRASRKRAALGVERLARVFELGHAARPRLPSCARASRACSRLASSVATSCASSASMRLDAAARRIQPALLALQLAGEFGHAAMRQVQRALRVLALLLGGEQRGRARR